MARVASARAFGAGVIPPPAERYDRDNEAQFRREVERRLAALATATNTTADQQTTDRDYLDVRDFGAVGDGVTDDAPAIQAALDYAALQMRQDSNTDPRRVVFFPPCSWGKYYRIAAPLHVGGPVALRGSRGHGHGLNFGSRSVLGPVFQGPAIVVSGVNAFVPLDPTPINNGVGSWFYSTNWSALGYPDPIGFTSPQFGCFDLRDAPDFDQIHGLSEFTLQMVFQAEPGMTPGDGVFIQSVGRWKPEERDEAGAFLLENAGESLVVQVRTTDGVFRTTTSGSANTLDGNPHLLELEYDGPNSTLTAFVDGAVVGQVAATGTIEMHPAEGIMLGDQYNIMPYVSAQARSPAGHYGHMKFSTTARWNGAAHGAAFNPTGVDADTLCVIDWGRVRRGPFIEIGTQPHGKAFIWWSGVQPQFVADDLTTNIGYLLEPWGWSIEDLTVENVHGTSPVLHSGIYVGNSSYFGHMSRVSVINGARIALRNGAIGNSYGCRFEHIYLSAWGGGRYGYLGGHNDTLTSFDDIWSTGGQVPFFTFAGSKVLRNLYIEANAETIYGFILGNHDIVAAATTLEQVNINAENGPVENTYKAAGLIVHGSLAPTLITMLNCGFEQLAYLSTPVLELAGQTPQGVDGGSESGALVSLRNCGFHMWGNVIPTDELVKTSSREPHIAVLLDGCAFAGLPPRALSLTPGAATAVARGLREVSGYSGATPAVVDAVTDASAVDAASLVFNVVTSSVTNPLMLVAVQYKANADGDVIQGVTLNAGAPLIQQAMQPIFRSPEVPVSGDIVLEVFATTTHRLGATEEVTVSFPAAVASGSKIVAGAVCLRDVLPVHMLEPVQWYSQVTGTHTVHTNDYETTRDGVVLLDFTAGGGAGAPTPDGGQSSEFGIDAGGGQVLGCSTKTQAVKGGGTMGQTLGLSASPSQHVVFGVRTAAPVFDLLRGDVFYVSLTQNVADSHLVNAYDGMEFTVILEQDGTGGWTFAWPSQVVGGGTVGTAPGDVLTQRFVVRGGVARKVDG